MRKFILAAAVVCISLLGSCKKDEQPSYPALKDYFPLQVGKYVTYNLDSIVFYTNFGVSAVIHSYQVKHVVDAQVTDALGRPAYRIIRYIRSYSTAPWVADNTFMAVNTGSSIEYTENNLRFIKLVDPIRQDYTWQGNKYIDVTSSSSQVKYFDGWDYAYDSVNTRTQVGALSIDSTIKVTEIDNQTSIDRTYSMEKYAKGIGLVYRNFLYWNNGTANHTYTDNSYGVIMTMIDHN